MKPGLGLIASQVVKGIWRKSLNSALWPTAAVGYYADLIKGGSLCRYGVLTLSLEPLQLVFISGELCVACY